MEKRPSYLNLLHTGELEKRVEKARALLSACTLCPHKCKINRLEGEKGFCRIGAKAMVASFGAHFGEEPPITGQRGSGTVFFSGCNMRCVFCQNFEISQGLEGQEVEKEYLAFIFLSLQEGGCHNVNLVTPTHVVPQILDGLLLAAKEGLKIPIVYNCGGYESLETLRLLDGIVDIYMPDMKYSDNGNALKYSRVKRYWDHCKKAVKEMLHQVGNLQMDQDTGAARRGLLIRHLVLPEDISGTRMVCRFIAEHLSPETVVNIMDQYRPCGMASKYPPLDRPVTPEEFARAVKWAEEEGLKRLLTF